MNATLINALLFDDWIGRAVAELRQLVRSARPGTAEREAHAAVDQLRARIRRYEREQPGYAADLQTALAAAEQRAAALAAQRAA